MTDYGATAWRKNWLRKHRKLWEFLPESQTAWPFFKRPQDPDTMRKIRNAAIADGIYSEKNYWKDTDYSLLKLMRVIREEDRIA